MEIFMSLEELTPKVDDGAAVDVRAKELVEGGVVVNPLRL